MRINAISVRKHTFAGAMATVLEKNPGDLVILASHRNEHGVK